VSSAPESAGRTASGGDPVEAALGRFLPAFPQGPRAIERVGLDHALDRVTAGDITAGTDSPPYSRSIVEGYLVNPEETRTASASGPVTFSVAGVIRPGDLAPSALPPKTVWEVFTGSALLPCRWGVIRQWDATRTGERVACTAPIQDGANIEAQGCDLSRGTVVVSKGTLLGPDQIALIAAQGLNTIAVAAKPIVGIFGSGDEVIPHTARLTPGGIWDCNTPALSAFVQREGGIPKPYGIVRDDFDAFVRAVTSALSHCGMVVIAGGTAAGGREFVRDLVAALGSPGVLVNGVPMRSGKPLIMGVVGEIPVVCVAGHPPEALRGFRLFGVPALARLLGRTA
jgi:molybdenum cofactor synthesis domain-containing protein